MYVYYLNIVFTCSLFTHGKYKYFAIPYIKDERNCTIYNVMHQQSTIVIF